MERPSRPFTPYPPENKPEGAASSSTPEEPAAFENAESARKLVNDIVAAIEVKRTKNPAESLKTESGLTAYLKNLEASVGREAEGAKATNALELTLAAFDTERGHAIDCWLERRQPDALTGKFEILRNEYLASAQQRIVGIIMREKDPAIMREAVMMFGILNASPQTSSQELAGNRGIVRNLAPQLEQARRGAPLSPERQQKKFESLCRGLAGQAAAARGLRHIFEDTLEVHGAAPVVDNKYGVDFACQQRPTETTKIFWLCQAKAVEKLPYGAEVDVAPGNPSEPILPYASRGELLDPELALIARHQADLVHLDRGVRLIRNLYPDIIDREAMGLQVTLRAATHADSFSGAYMDQPKGSNSSLP